MTVPGERSHGAGLAQFGHVGRIPRGEDLVQPALLVGVADELNVDAGRRGEPLELGSHVGQSNRAGR